MRFLLAVALVCVVFSPASAETNTPKNTGSQTDRTDVNDPDLGLALRYGNQVFHDVCVGTHAKLAYISAAHDAYITNEMPTDVVDLELNTLGLDDVFDNVQLGNHSFSVNLFLDPLPSEVGEDFFLHSLHGFVELSGEPGRLNLCSIGFVGVPANDLVVSLERWLQRPATSEKVVDIATGGKTRWVIWDTSDSPTGIVLLAVLIAEDGRELPGPRLMAVAME